MRFTNNPYEGFMKEKSYFKGVPPLHRPPNNRFAVHQEPRLCHIPGKP